MKILLANIPWQRNGKSGVRAGSRWPHIKDNSEGDYIPFPFFLAYSASLLKQNNFEVKFIDAVAEGLSEKKFLSESDIGKLAPDLMVIETSTVSLEDDLDLMEKIDKQIPIALCGPDVNIRKEAFLKENKRISYVLKGEYEYTLLDLVRHLDRNLDLTEVKGINFRNNNGDVYANPERSLIKNLDDLPWPLREELPIKKYLDAPGGMPLPSVQMLASRGCPYGCIFCLWPQVMYGGRNYRVRDPKDVVDEMEYLVNQMRFHSIYFDDDTFGLDIEWTHKFIKELKNRNGNKGLDIPWAIMARADALDKKTLEQMRSVGLFAVKYGIESGSQELINKSGKNLDLNKAIDIITFTKRLGIKVHLTFMFGLPGESKESIRRTIDLALGLEPTSVQFSIATPFPGTRYFEELEKKGLLISKRWSDYDGNYKGVFETSVLSAEELKEAKDKAYFIWGEHCKKRGDFSTNALIKKFVSNLKVLGITYTFKKVYRFLKRQGQLYYHNIRLLTKKPVSSIFKRYIHTRLTLIGILDGYRAYVGPFLAQVDLTNDCNNNCIGCWCNSPLLNEMRLDKELARRQTLPLNLVKDLINDLHRIGTQQIYIAGGGEPFMHPNIMDILRFIKKKKMVCYINTNFTLVNEEIIKELIALKIDHLTISLWAGTPRTYALIHPNKNEDTFYQIEKRLKFLCNHKSCRPGYPLVKLYNVICNLNYQEIDEMVDFALGVGAESVEFTLIDTIPGKTDTLLLSEEQRIKLLDSAYKLKDKQNFWLTNNNFLIFKLDHFLRRISTENSLNGEYDRELINELPCYIGWAFTRILANGDVNACLKAHRIPVGNIYYQRFSQIWNGELQRQFRKKTKTTKKIDPIFRFIGNDPNFEIGCFRGCDDIDRNEDLHKRLLALTTTERIILASAKNILRASQNNKC